VNNYLELAKKISEQIHLGCNSMHDLERCRKCPYWVEEMVHGSWRRGRCIYHDIERPKVIAVDLDGVILEFDEWKGHRHFGKPVPGVRDALKKLKEMGFVIVVWTTRDNIEDIARVLREHKIPFDYINENPFQPPDCSNKIYADVYVDDRAVEFNGNWDEVIEKIKGKVGKFDSKR